MDLSRPPAGAPGPRQVEILPVIWHNEQVLDLRGPSLRVRILSFRTPKYGPPHGCRTPGSTPFQKQE
jgi:small subunit ribosomal protein S16